jgi:FMN phosphatase YigB (HAD superfamily)
MIGDNPHADVLGSLNAGYRFAVLIDRTMNPAKFAELKLPDNVIYVSTLSEVRQLLPLCAIAERITA